MKKKKIKVTLHIPEMLIRGGGGGGWGEQVYL